MKILFLGEIGLGQTSLMRMRAFERLGHEVRGVHTTRAWSQASWLTRQCQRRLQRGTVVDRINRSVVESAREFRPELIWAEKQEFLRRDTIEELRRLGARAVHFTPDPYFSVAWKRTSVMDDALHSFDALVYCKSYERANYEAVRKPLFYMPLGYCDEVHRPLLSEDEKWTCSVGFLGGWDPERERLLHEVAAAGLDVKIWGGYWDFLRTGQWSPRRYIILRQLAGRDTFRFHRDPHIARALQGGEVYGDDYARALSGAKIGLGFLRRVCPDQHTTRTFEIPACGSLLLGQRTAEHLSFFEEGKEAEFFDSREEMLEKIRFYTGNSSARDRIAAAGYRRCCASLYAYRHRLRATLAAVERGV